MAYERLIRWVMRLTLLAHFAGCGNDSTKPSDAGKTRTKTAGSSKTHDASADEYELGRKALDKGNYDLAITYFDKAIYLHSDDARIWSDRGNARYEKRDFGRAIADYTESIRLDPKNAEGYIGRGLVYFATRETDKAIENFTEAIHLNPNDASAFALRAECCTKNRNNDDAIKDSTEAIRLNPKSAFAYTIRGVAYAGERDYEKAIHDYSAALIYDPQSSMAYARLAWLWATCPRDEFRNGEKALNYALKAMELSHSMHVECAEALAAASAENGQFSEAVRWQQIALGTEQFTKETRVDAEMRLKLYEEKKSYREPDRPADPPS